MLLYLVLIFCTLQVGTLSCDDDIAFSGGYFSVEWQKSPSLFRKITVDFKPKYEVGVLFFMELHLRTSSANSSVVSMLSYNHRSLIFSVQQPTFYHDSVISSRISLTSFNSLSLHIRKNGKLKIKLNSEGQYGYSLNSNNVDVINLLIGGARDFTVYHQFPVQSYFIGTLRNLKVGSNCIDVVHHNKLSGSQAVLHDNCTMTVDSFVEFNTFSHILTNVTVQSTSYLRVNFTITTRECVGKILHLSGGSFTLALSASKLIVTVTNSSERSAICMSSSVIDQSKWVNVMITYINDTIKYVINDKESGSCHIDLGIVDFTGALVVGASQNASGSFVGRLRHLYWNDSEINLIGLAATNQQPCVNVGPWRCNDSFNTTLSSSCANCKLHDLPINWATFDISVRSNLTMIEQKIGTIMSNNFNLSFSQCLTDASLHELHKNIIFTLQEPNRHYGIINGTFTFEDAMNNMVHYQHSGTEETKDVINLLVHIWCGSKLLYKKSIKMYIHISPTNDKPWPSLVLSDLSMVVGTRKLITQDVIRMVDSDTSVEHLHCTNNNVAQDDGTRTGQFEWTDKPGHKITGPFYQNDINTGKVMIRLFLNAIGTSKVALTISDGTNTNYGAFKVYGTSGIIKLIKNESVRLVENSTVFISEFHLFANTSFNNQKPIVTFILTNFPKFGQLALAYNQSFTARNVSRFTQHDIDSRKLFYSHTVHVQNSTEDCFNFQLMVDDFAGDNGTYCVSIVIKDDLPNLVINVTMAQNITLFEGRTKLISSNDLVITPGLELPSGQITSLHRDVIILLQFTKLPKYGILSLTNSNGITTVIVAHSNVSLDQLAAGLLVYNHKSEEEHQDSFRIKIIVQNFSHLLIQQSPPVSDMDHVVFINVTPVNNKSPQIQIHSDLVVMEGSHENLTNATINITDADRPPEKLIVYVTPKVEFNGHFASWQNISIVINEFSVSEMNEGKIVFVHQVGNKLEADYVLTVSDGLHNSSKEFKVVAKSIMLNVTTTHSTEQCSLHLDLLNSTVVQIHNGLFNVKLSSGNLPNIQMTTTMDSHLYFKNNSGFFSVTKIFKRDIDQGHIWYVVKDNKTRVEQEEFGLYFSIGHAEPVYVQFQVCLSLLPYPQFNASSSLLLELPKHENIAINSSVLFGANTRSQLFDVRYELVVFPTSGQLVMLSGDPVIKFSQKDINEGKIFYHNYNYSSDGDGFILTLSNKFYEHTANITVAINIFLSTLEVVNNGFRVMEGGNHTIGRDELYATGPPGHSVVFRIDSPPIHGNITLRTNQKIRISHFSKEQLDGGLVVYSNDDEEFYYDSMEITIEAIPLHIQENIPQTKSTYFGTVNITIDLVNDHKPRRWNFTNSNRVVDGHLFIFTPYIISFLDDDIDMNISLLMYTVVYGPFNGRILFVHNGSSTNHFLQQNIYNSEIAYQSTESFVANDKRLVDHIALEVSDGELTTNDYVSFSIIPYTVKVVNNESLSVDEGGRMALLAKNLLFLADKANPKAEDSEYIYNITRHPTHGQLLMPNSCNCTFTQEQLRNGSLMYEHDDSDTIKDNFTFTVTVQGYATAVMTFIININPVDDEPPSVVYLDQLLVGLGSKMYFNESILQATDSEAGVSELVFNVLKAPMFGSIKRQVVGPHQDSFVVSSFTQEKVSDEAIYYQHERVMNDEWVDNVILSLSDGRNAYGDHIMITFFLIPDVLPIRVKGIELTEVKIAIVHVTSQNIEVVHPYLSTLELYINVTKPVEYGQLLSFSHQSPTAYFNSSAMKNKSIFYYYEEDHEVTKDTFKFVATAGGITSNEQTFVITVNSINDETPVIVRNSVISLWASELKVISASDLFASDSDAHPSDELNYIIDTNTSLGYFAHKGAHHIPITTFSQDDIIAGNVIFKSNPTVNDTELEINFTVTDGIHDVTSYIIFEINVLSVMVDSANVENIEVNMGADQVVKLSAHANDDSVKRILTYQVSVCPMLGLIVNKTSGLEVTNFTQEQINNQLIVYKHIAVDRWEAHDTVKFVVSTDLAEPVQTSLNVSVKLKKSSTSYLAASESLNVDEGGTVCLNESILDARNVLYEVWKNSDQSVGLDELTIQYIIVSCPSRGELKSGDNDVLVGDYFNHTDLKSSVGVCYCHDGSESTSDHFSVMINISYNHTDVWYRNNTVVDIPVYIRPLNDEHPVLKRFEKNIYGFWHYNYIVSIRPEVLYVEDNDTSDDKLIYTIVSNHWNTMTCKLSNRPILNFTQNDINKRRVMCEFPPELPPSVSSSNLTFYFTDGNFISNNYTMYCNKVTLTLTVLHNMSELRYPQERGFTGVTLTSEQLNSSTTGYRFDTIYKVTSPPSNGYLIKANHLGTVENFTQVDIDNGMIQYVAGNMKSHSDSFTMEVTNRHATPHEGITVHVTAMAMIDNSNTSTLTLLSVKDSQPLPADLFNITALDYLSNSDPLFTVINELSYGHLYLQSDEKSSNSLPFTFKGSQFIGGKVFYVLDENISNGTEVIQLRVEVDNIQAGFVQVSIGISMLPPTTSTSPTATDRLESKKLNGYSKGSAFTPFALVPIIGVPSFILMAVIILVCFWCSQKWKEKRRSVAAHGSSAICMASHIPTHHKTMIETDIDLSSSEKDSEHLSNNSDEGISMAMPPEDRMEDEDVVQGHAEEHFRPRPVMDPSHYHRHSLTPVYMASGYEHINPQHATQLMPQKFPILKNEEYWL